METTRRLRTWAAALTLYFLAPILGEVFSFNTPPLKLVLDPGTFIFEPALYGSGALLIREVARRRGLGWPAILVMGASYGILEEGVFIHSWFNATFEGLHSLAVYGWAWDTSWVWAVGLTGFHAVFSVTIPILLTEAMYPRVAALPWLNRFWLRLIVGWFAFTVLLGAVAYGFILSRDKGYTHPPLTYLLAIALVVVLFFIGSRLRRRAQPRIIERPTPGLWSLRLFGGGMTLAFFFAFYGISALQPFALISIGGMAAVVLYSVWRIVRWSRSPGWGAEQRLALASGAFGFWLVLSPLFYTTGSPGAQRAGNAHRPPARFASGPKPSPPGPSRGAAMRFDTTSKVVDAPLCGERAVSQCGKRARNVRRMLVVDRYATVARRAVAASAALTPATRAT